MSKANNTNKDIKITDVLFAFSDPVRLDIVKLLAKNAYMTCGQLNADRPKSSMSHHYNILRNANIIKTEVRGREHYNSLCLEEIELKFPGLLESILHSD
jgi:DNA-binding transcriptional ArsR family regulator